MKDILDVRSCGVMKLSIFDYSNRRSDQHRVRAGRRVAPQQCSENERYVVFRAERGRLELLEDAQFIVLQEPELANVKVEGFSGTIHARNPYAPEASAIAICKTERLSLRAISVC